jgi:hypothetical protein
MDSGAVDGLQLAPRAAIFPFNEILSISARLKVDFHFRYPARGDASTN